MAKFPMRRFKAILILGAMTALVACGGSDPSGPTPSGPNTFTLPSGQTPVAGGPLLLPAMDLGGANPSRLTATVGGEPASLIVSANGELRILLPLYLDPVELWFAVPAAPQDIELMLDGDLLAKSEQGVRVVTPPDAPDATVEALSDLSRRFGAFASWRESFVSPPNPQDQHMYAVIEGLRAFVASEEEGSFRDLVANYSAKELRLSDALIAVSGTRGAFSEIADLAEDLPLEDKALQQAGGGGLCGIPFPDTELAAMMQFSAMAKLFASNYLSGIAASASGWESSLGALATITYLDRTPLFDGLGKLLAIGNAYFALLDLIANKYVTAMMPTVIESITVTVDDPSMTAGETTESLKVICVRNDPPPFTLTDVIGQLLNVVGLIANPPADVIERLENLGIIMLDRVNGFIGSYAADHPGISLDVELSSMPEISWTADIEDPDLLELMSADTAVAMPLTDELEWEAPLGASGATNVSCRPASNPDAVFVEDFLGISYGGAAFGFDVVASNSVTLTIDDLPSMALSFDEGSGDFYIDRPTPVRFRAGYNEETGVNWTSGIQIQIVNAEGCTFTPFSGTTDANGYFDAEVTPFESEFWFETLVTGADGQDHDDSFGEYNAEPVAFDFIGGSASSTITIDSKVCSPTCGQSMYFYHEYTHDSQYGPTMAGAASSGSESDSGTFNSAILEGPMMSMASGSGSGSTAVIEGDDQVTLSMMVSADATADFQDGNPDEESDYWRWHARGEGSAGASRSLVVRGWDSEVNVSFTPPSSGTATLGPFGTWTNAGGFLGPGEWTETEDGFGLTSTFSGTKGFNFGISCKVIAEAWKGTDDPPGGRSDSKSATGSLVVTIKLVRPEKVAQR